MHVSALIVVTVVFLKHCVLVDLPNVDPAALRFTTTEYLYTWFDV